MKRLFQIWVLCMICFVSAWVVVQWRVYHEHKEMPPGYVLITDGKGHYEAMHEETGLILTVFRDSLFPDAKQTAINRAWNQWHFGHDGAIEAAKWHLVEPTNEVQVEKK